ncbi:ABC transporter permease [Leptospira semungkisensis]|uniref:ABC transporter permease n=1 Tax=Leptospira semungkisensis TaxID=2484985 RepID=A0A4R9G7E5_9LEPT|nr:ABC transporter permease [Leptospira semungkisensis]TGK07474.1 ABC transporter permease [Leptospira semungkisensis]
MSGSIRFFFQAYIRQIPVLVRLTLIQVFRRRAIFFLFSLLLFFFVGEWTCTTSVGQEVTKGIPMSVYFILTSLWVTIFLIIITSDLLRQDIDSQIHTLWLSRPLDPGVYLAGKGFALLLLVVLFILAVFGIQSWYALEVPWDFLIFQGAMMFTYIFFLSFAFLITLTSNQTLSILLSFGLLLVTSILDQIVYQGYLDSTPMLNETQKLIVKIFYWVLPQIGTVYHHSSNLLEGKGDGPVSYGLYSFFQVSAWLLILKASLWLTTRRQEI